MTEEIKNDIDKLDGMIKIKGKCGYEIIGGCSDLRRLEQENKELLEKFDEAQDDIESLTNANNHYFKENKELKAYKDVNEDFKKAWDELNEKYKQLRSVLEEIREIVSDEIDKTDSDDELMQIYGIIYNKIKEVLQ